MASTYGSKVDCIVVVLPSDYVDEEVTVDAWNRDWHTRYSGTPTKMWDALLSYVDENVAHNLIEEATGRGIDAQ